VDLARNRISLTMKLDAAAPAKGQGARGDNSFRPAGKQERYSPPRGGAQQPAPQGAMAAAFAKLQGKR
jgi:uncharacterized protein